MPTRRLTLACLPLVIAFGHANGASDAGSTAFPMPSEAEMARMTKTQRATLAIFRSFEPRMAEAPTVAERQAVEEALISRLNQSGLPRTLKNWSATVERTDIDDDRALIFLSICPGFVARTAMIELTDTENTRILPGSALYRASHMLTPGEAVRFDGFLVKFYLDGKGDSALPVGFMMRFSAIRPGI